MAMVVTEAAIDIATCSAIASAIVPMVAVRSTVRFKLSMDIKAESSTWATQDTKATDAASQVAAGRSFDATDIANPARTADGNMSVVVKVPSRLAVVSRCATAVAATAA